MARLRSREGVSMKAAVATKYEPPDVLQLRGMAKPIPRANEVLIKVRATTVSSGDVRTRSLESPLLEWLPIRVMLGFTGPRKKVLGFAIAGEVEVYEPRQFCVRVRPGGCQPAR